MPISNVKGKTIFVNKGANQGVVENSVYDIHRNHKAETVHLGIAIVSHISENSCRLKAYPVSTFRIKAGDLLVLNGSATELSMKMQNDYYWKTLQNEQLSKRCAFSDGQVFVPEWNSPRVSTDRRVAGVIPGHQHAA